MCVCVCVSGAYLVPYIILLFLIGIPLFYLELAVGQRIRRGSIGVWNHIYPKLGGIGVSSLVVSANPFTLSFCGEPRESDHNSISVSFDVAHSQNFCWEIKRLCCFYLQFCCFLAVYYNTIIGWSIFYFGSSFQYSLPWAECPTNGSGKGAGK